MQPTTPSFIHAKTAIFAVGQIARSIFYAGEIFRNIIFEVLQNDIFIKGHKLVIQSIYLKKSKEKKNWGNHFYNVNKKGKLKKYRYFTAKK